MFTNINLVKDGNQYVYMVEYKDGSSYHIDDLNYILPDDNNVTFGQDNHVLYKTENRWLTASNELNSYIPEKCEGSILRLYIPQFSIDSVKGGVKYMMVVKTWIGDKCVCLGNFYFTIFDAIATPKIIRKYNNVYYECVDFNIVNPWRIVYDDEWKDFRINVCKEHLIDDTYQYNSTGALLNISLYVVNNDNGEININSNYISGQNSLKLSHDTSDFLNLQLFADDNKPDTCFTCALNFNKSYCGSLNEYILETYDIDKFIMSYELIVSTESKIYALLNSGDIVSNYPITYDFMKSDLKNEFAKSNFAWVPGVSICSSINIKNIDGEDILYIISNKIPLTKNVYKYFNGEDFVSRKKTINNINLTEIGMYTYNINAVNKIEQNIVKLNTPENTSSNKYVPIFFSSKDMREIHISPDIIETICINLDEYKSKVEYFSIMLEGIKFNEIGRVNSGVLFKIVGNRLPRSKNEGIYYIINQNDELVTKGKYKYVL